MLKIMHKSIQLNAPLDTTGFTGDLQHDSQLASVQALVGGRVATVGATGAKLADADAGDQPIGFIINDVAGYFMENVPALASGRVPLTHGPVVVVTDQIVTTDTFAVGDKVYLGGTGNKGLLTKTASVAVGGYNRAVGIALSTASAASPELTVAFF